MKDFKDILLEKLDINRINLVTEFSPYDNVDKIMDFLKYKGFKCLNGKEKGKQTYREFFKSQGRGKYFYLEHSPTWMGGRWKDLRFVDMSKPISRKNPLYYVQFDNNYIGTVIAYIDDWIAAVNIKSDWEHGDKYYDRIAKEMEEYFKNK